MSDNSQDITSRKRRGPYAFSLLKGNMSGDDRSTPRVTKWRMNSRCGGELTSLPPWSENNMDNSSSGSGSTTLHPQNVGAIGLTLGPDHQSRNDSAPPAVPRPAVPRPAGHLEPHPPSSASTSRDNDSGKIYY